MSGKYINNVTKVVDAGICIGCGECRFCEHIFFEEERYNVPTPVVTEGCTSCGECLRRCLHYPGNFNPPPSRI